MTVKDLPASTKSEIKGRLDKMGHTITILELKLKYETELREMKENELNRMILDKNEIINIVYETLKLRSTLREEARRPRES